MANDKGKIEPGKAYTEIVYRPLADLHPHPKNPRKATEAAIKKLAESIKNNPAFFEARPILLSDRTGELVIISGEQRSKAAKLLGMEFVPTILISGLSEEREEYILTTENTHVGVWDEEKITTWQREILVSWGVADFAPVEKKTEEKYTRKIESPIYQPKGEKPDISELVDTAKRDELVERIKDEKLPKEIRDFCSWRQNGIWYSTTKRLLNTTRRVPPKFSGFSRIVR